MVSLVYPSLPPTTWKQADGMALRCLAHHTAAHATPFQALIRANEPMPALVFVQRGSTQPTDIDGYQQQTSDRDRNTTLQRPIRPTLTPRAELFVNSRHVADNRTQPTSSWNPGAALSTAASRMASAEGQYSAPQAAEEFHCMPASLPD
ncbi:hypothetical protein CT0861_00077 [Colletotrichum tofieldiae]|uniref:Uncharacterized protein n=1 Tax=Colletotrichum tofieldiae TaxID=708197 RepID=A0A161YNU1_9PEZI|nr:hypothetical protein CT0861_00077 [Colletotrichum tofieldiae]